MSLRNSLSIFRQPPEQKHVIPSIVTQDMNILGNIVSDGNLDFDGALNGNIRCRTLTIRAHGSVKGEVVADSVFVYGRIKGLIRARHVQLYAGCNVEGIIMHETLAIEDGAHVDGKFKRTDKPEGNDKDDAELEFAFDEIPVAGHKLLDNIRLIR